MEVIEENDYKLKQIERNSLIASIDKILSENEIQSKYTLNLVNNYFFKHSRYFYNNFVELYLDEISIDEFLKIYSIIKQLSNDRIKIYSRFFQSKSRSITPLNYLYSLVNLSTIKFSKKYTFNFFLSPDKTKYSCMFTSLFDLLNSKIKCDNPHITKNDFRILFYMPFVKENKSDDFFQTSKFVQLIEYDNTDKQIVQIMQSFGSPTEELPRLVVGDKFGNIIFNDVYNSDLIIEFLTNENFKFSQNNDSLEKKNIIQIEKQTFEKFQQEISDLLVTCKNKPFFETVNNTIQIESKETITVNGKDKVFKYFLGRIKDNSAVFFNSFFHRNFYKVLPTINNKKVFSRFKSKDKHLIKDALLFYRSKLNVHNLDSPIVVKKRWNYALGMVRNSYKLYNNKSPSLVFDEAGEKINEYSIMRKEIQKFTYNLSPSLKANYKIFKKFDRKNFYFQFEESENWENERGKRYLLYFNFCSIDEECLNVMSCMINLQHKYSLTDLKLNFETVFHVSEDDDEDLPETFLNLMNHIPSRLVDDLQVHNLYSYINPYDSEISNLFVYIDTDGNVFPFIVRDETLLEEKLLSLIYPKVEISQQNYKLIKNLSDDFFIENFLTHNEYNYRYTFNLVLTKNKVLDKEDNLLDEKFYVRGKIRIRESDYTLLNNKIGNNNNFSPIDFYKCLEQKLKDNSDVDLSTVFADQIIYKETSLSKFTKSNCVSCKNVLGNYKIYFCFFCEVFYCDSCEKNIKENYNCYLHNRVFILDYEKAHSGGYLEKIEISKFGNNTIKALKCELSDLGFCCSFCDNTLHDSRYTCLNCRGCDLVLNSSDANSNGFVEICQKCLNLISKYNDDQFDKLAIESMTEKVESRDGHLFDSHIYIKIERSTGNYSNY